MTKEDFLLLALSDSFDKESVFDEIFSIYPGLIIPCGEIVANELIGLFFTHTGSSVLYTALHDRLVATVIFPTKISGIVNISYRTIHFEDLDDFKFFTSKFGIRLDVQ